MYGGSGDGACALAGNDPNSMLVNSNAPPLKTRLTDSSFENSDDINKLKEKTIGNIDVSQVMKYDMTMEERRNISG